MCDCWYDFDCCLNVFAVRELNLSGDRSISNDEQGVETIRPWAPSKPYPFFEMTNEKISYLQSFSRNDSHSCSTKGRNVPKSANFSHIHRLETRLFIPISAFLLCVSFFSPVPLLLSVLRNAIVKCYQQRQLLYNCRRDNLNISALHRTAPIDDLAFIFVIKLFNLFFFSYFRMNRNELCRLLLWRWLTSFDMVFCEVASAQSKLRVRG